MNLNDTKISTRLGFGFAAMVALIALLGASSLYQLTAIRSEFTTVMGDRYPKVKVANDIRAVNNEVAQALRNLFVMSDPDDLKAQYDLIAGSSKRTNDNVEYLKNAVHDEVGKAALARLVQARAEYRAPRDRVVELLKAGRSEEAKIALLLDLRPKQVAYMDRVDDLIKLQDGLMTGAGKAAEDTVADAKLTVWTLLGLALVLGLVLPISIIRSITGPIRRAIAVSRAVTSGDLSVQFEASGRNETAQLLHSLKDMQASLTTVVSDVRRNSESVATASAQIAHGNQDLSSRTEQQASALEETAASMEELSSTVKQNSDNAKQANQLASSATRVAVKGGEVVSKVVDTMKGINESSKRIADIIGVIDGIAFQTNILALNAAVEAARAGEQGRGFAVVASEVRSLAGRSAEAAKEIKRLIGTSVERVEQGTLLVTEAGATMTEVVSSIQRVTDIMGEITSASSEQSAGVAQIGEAVTQMDKATQQNAALVEESAAAAESLKGQAEALVQAVAVFKLGAPGAGRSPAAEALHAVAPVRDEGGTGQRPAERTANVTRPDGRATPEAARDPSTPIAGHEVSATHPAEDWTSF